MDSLHAWSRNGQHVEAGIILENQGRGFMKVVCSFLEEENNISECVIPWNAPFTCCFVGLEQQP